MTTKSGGTEKPPTDTHLISDHDNIGEANNWCGAESFNNTEAIAETTCTVCLKAAAIYGKGATERLLQIAGSDSRLDLGYPRCQHKECKSQHYRVIQRHDWEVDAGMNRNYADDSKPPTNTSDFEQAPVKYFNCICECLIPTRPCNDYRAVPLDRPECVHCGHGYLCHEESRVEGEEW